MGQASPHGRGVLITNLLSCPDMGAGTILREARRRAGLTQRELARMAGVPQPAVSRIERDRPPSDPASLITPAEAKRMSAAGRRLYGLVDPSDRGL